MMRLAQKNFCPVCGSFMGLTRRPGDIVFCSWGDDGAVDGPCARYGYAMHPGPEPAVGRLGYQNRTWQGGDHGGDFDDESSAEEAA